MKKFFALALVFSVLAASAALAAETLTVEGFKSLGPTKVIESGWGIVLQAKIGGTFIVGDAFQCVQTPANPGGYAPGQTVTLKKGQPATAWLTSQAQ